MDTPPHKLSDDRVFWVGLGLFVITLTLYGQTFGFGFVNYDDDLYVYDNPYVQQGLTWESVRWAFTSLDIANWHPLTLLSHIMDWELFGARAGLHHAKNVFFHGANTWLLFIVLVRMTGALWRPAFVAALFALHPLHVESVAWISERKDVLSTLFWMLALLAYARYAERPGTLRYALVVAAFALGLMAKPMVVTLPFVLLLLDYWPLKRFHGIGRSQWPRIGQLVMEKVPLFVLTAGASAITLIAQRGRGATLTMDQLDFWTRAANAIVSYALYLWKTVAPVDLAVWYPYPERSLFSWEVGLSLAFLVTVTVLVIVFYRRFPYGIVGWLWYRGTLVPVIGLLQVGDQAMADRYTYIPLIGVFIMVGWGLGDVVKRRESLRVPATAAATAALAVLTALTWWQIGFWKDGETLSRHAIAVTEGNTKAHNNLGVNLLKADRPEEAAAHFRAALEISPHNVDARSNLGAALLSLGKAGEAEVLFREVREFWPDKASAHVNLAVAVAEQGRIAEARTLAEEALRIDPNYANARKFLNHLNEQTRIELE